MIAQEQLIYYGLDDYGFYWLEAGFVSFCSLYYAAGLSGSRLATKVSASLYWRRWRVERP
jgi:hypothetical protein